MRTLARLLGRRTEPEPVVTLDLPAEAYTGRLSLLRAGDRDQVVRAVAGGDWRAFERPLPAVLFACCLRWPGLVVDAGANSGFYALLALAARRENRVLAFEPDARVLPLLHANLRTNGFARRADVRAQALGDRSGKASLYLPFDDHGLVETSSSLDPGFKERHSAVVAVAVTTLDKALAGRRAPSLIKIDVEGHEAQVLVGAARTIAAARPVIALELLSGADWPGVNRLVAEQGYRAVRLRPEAAVVEPVLEFDHFAWNHMLVPAEKWSDFEAILRLCSLTS